MLYVCQSCAYGEAVWLVCQSVSVVYEYVGSRVVSLRVSQLCAHWESCGRYFSRVPVYSRAVGLLVCRYLARWEPCSRSVILSALCTWGAVRLVCLCPSPLRKWGAVQSIAIIPWIDDGSLNVISGSASIDWALDDGLAEALFGNVSTSWRL